MYTLVHIGIQSNDGTVNVGHHIVNREGFHTQPWWPLGLAAFLDATNLRNAKKIKGYIGRLIDYSL